MQLVGPVSDDLIPCSRLVVDLVLEDVVAAGSVAVLVEGDRSPCTSCRNKSPERNPGSDVVDKLHRDNILTSVHYVSKVILS